MTANVDVARIRTRLLAIYRPCVSSTEGRHYRTKAIAKRQQLHRLAVTANPHAYPFYRSVGFTHRHEVQTSSAGIADGARCGRRIALAPVGPIKLSQEAQTMALNRQDIRESIERAGDEHWEALVRHHTEVYPESNPTPGDVARAEAERLNELGLGDNPNLTLVESRVERVPPAVRITHVFEDRQKGTRFETEPFTGYE